MAMWEPFRGCHKISDGCENCYIHLGDKKRGVDTNLIQKTSDFYLPIERKANGEYKIKSGSKVYLCFSSDFLIEEADSWRDECFQMMRERQDLHFIFLTKRIDRLEEALPDDWNDGYSNVLIGCTIENQKNADFRLPIFYKIPIKHRNIICQPLLEKINIEKYLDASTTVVVGGEYGKEARKFDYNWALDLRDQCISKNALFELRQLGTYFVKDGKEYTLQYKDLSAQAKKANINILDKK